MKVLRYGLFFSLVTLSTASTVFTQGVRNFLEVLSESGIQCDIDLILRDPVRKAVLYEYGAVLVSKDAELPRSRSCEISEKPLGQEYKAEVDKFANGFRSESSKFLFGEFFLQSAAKKSLEKVFRQYPNGSPSVARNCNVKQSERALKCTKVGNFSLNNDWALRSYDQTLKNWEGVNKTLDTEATRTAATCETFSWNPNIDYQTQKSKRPKIYQVAIPGTSQHHFGLAIDVNNVDDTKFKKCDAVCIARLEANGWFRTVRYDSYHFTYLGFTDPERLMAKGLKQVVCKDKVVYWVPNIPGYHGIGSWTCEDI